MSDTRPCSIKSKDDNKPAVFHMFFTEAYVLAPSLMVGGHSGGQVSAALALVEYPDGSMHKVYAENVVFADKALTVRLNTDVDKVWYIRDALQKNGGYCPCQIEHTPDTKCMCKAFREQTTPGPCHCGLYIKEVK